MCQPPESCIRSFIKYPAFKGCSWRPIQAHPQHAHRHPDKLVELASSRAFNWYAEPYEPIFVLDPLILIECLVFKGCSWRPIPAHPRCAYWLIDTLVELASSRAFKLYAEPRKLVFALNKSILIKYLPSRDAVDDQFQHTLDVHTDILLS